ncbi:sugar phosphate isomerase/epimerase family protein [Paenibacillus sp. 481]|uniref:sugar phosphate isomerase/epimerase family protein n=1 Tax=Paenibacillus sp. 481 TaxID=2835869 RepID=UPI001E458FE6|nr:sugar phosphate isomerase/epimerase family protein [Paenibacillus sp. 481]UHA75566.1 sugar phosphate isomerase/epimerase [Paenibacillus sp. 481]
MKYSLCTISFRHHLVSFADIVQFAREQTFDGIELWGIHALHLYESERERTEEQLQWMRKQQLSVAMISDYLDVSPSAYMDVTLDKCLKLIEIGKWLGVNKIRTFAGQQPSNGVTTTDRGRYVRHLRMLCELCQEHGFSLLAETHPNTLSDNLSSTLQLLDEVRHDALQINLDFLHMWESGADPIDSYKQLAPWVKHYHLKNISAAEHLHVFQPQNVYAASGNRTGMVPLAEGAVNYEPIIDHIDHTDHFASLEWFGPQPFEVLSREIKWLRALKEAKLEAVYL